MRSCFSTLEFRVVLACLVFLLLLLFAYKDTTHSLLKSRLSGYPLKIEDGHIYDDNIDFATEWLAEVNRTDIVRQAKRNAEVKSIKPLICLGIITHNRKGLKYLYVTLYSILRDIFQSNKEGEEFRTFLERVTLFVLNANKNIEGDPILKDVVDAGIDVIPSTSTTEIEKNYRAKQNEDYISALEHCSKTQAKITLIIEDDAWVGRDFFKVVQKDIYPKLKHIKDWLWIKLYFDPYWDFFSNRSMVFIGFLSFHVGCIFVILYILLSAFFNIANRLDRLRSAFLFVVAFGTTILSMLIIGYPNLPFDRIGFVEHFKPGSTVAQIYPNSKLEVLIDCMSKNKLLYNSDLNIGECTKEHNLRGYHFKPYLAKHFGVKSTRDV
ncbi:hypothetical protein AKO1_012841 [Acrasis kona]|uniref:Uncharacterized protein n=1 Tax=Acrasis kona TaxID=1008807 RepID=A0AAW2YV82_9EUKA